MLALERITCLLVIEAPDVPLDQSESHSVVFRVTAAAFLA
jgi:hypothetical protein